MKTRSLGWLVGLGGVACSFASCAEPATQCQVGLAGAFPYAAVYTPMGSPSPAGCEMMNPGVVQLGDLIGMEFYNPASADGTTFDLTKATVAIKSDTIGQEYNAYAGYTCAPAQCGTKCGPLADGCGGILDCGGCPSGQTCGGGGTHNVCGSGQTCTKLTCADLAADCGPAGDGCGGMLMCGTCPVPPPCAKDADCGTNGPCVMGACAHPDTCGGDGFPSVCGHPIVDTDPTHAPYASGAFAQQFPDANDMCQVTNLVPAQQDLSSGPKTSPALPTDSVGYTWTNVNVYVTAAAQGTQFSADMTYTENGCTASYHVVGMWPGISCTVTNMDPSTMAPINQVPNADLCNPCAEPDKQRFTGSGISPDFPTTCKQIFATTCDNANPPNCLSADPYGRDPYYCVLAGPGDPPQLNPNPPTCLENVSGTGNGGSGGGGSSPDGGS